MRPFKIGLILLLALVAAGCRAPKSNVVTATFDSYFRSRPALYPLHYNDTSAAGPIREVLTDKEWFDFGDGQALIPTAEGQSHFRTAAWTKVVDREIYLVPAAVRRAATVGDCRRDGRVYRCTVTWHWEPTDEARTLGITVDTTERHETEVLMRRDTDEWLIDGALPAEAPEPSYTPEPPDDEEMVQTQIVASSVPEFTSDPSQATDTVSTELEPPPALPEDPSVAGTTATTETVDPLKPPTSLDPQIPNPPPGQ